MEKKKIDVPRAVLPEQYQMKKRERERDMKRKKKTVKNSHVPFSIQPKLADYYIASD